MSQERKLVDRAAKPIDDRPDQAKRLRMARLARGFKTARAACDFFGWNYNTYSQHERGLTGLRPDVAQRYGSAFRVMAGWLITGEGTMEDRHRVPVLGKIGDLGSIESFGKGELFEIDSLVPFLEDVVGYKVATPLQYPKHFENDVLVVLKEGVPFSQIEDGEECVIRAEDGKMYLRNLTRTDHPQVFILEGQNLRPILNVRVVWASYILAKIRSLRVENTVESHEQPTPRKSARDTA